MVSIKIHESTYRKVIAVCDSELIGKKFEEKNKQLDLRENFFSGDDFTDEDAIKFLKIERAEDSTFNIVGTKSIELAKEANIINEKSVGVVASIPFALILL